jgi:hypothetical protein
MGSDWEDQQATVGVFCFINAAVYFAALLYLGGSIWRSAVIAIIVLLAGLFGFGRTVLLRTGVVIILLALSGWAGVTPRMWIALVQ